MKIPPPPPPSSTVQALSVSYSILTPPFFSVKVKWWCMTLPCSPDTPRKDLSIHLLTFTMGWGKNLSFLPGRHFASPPWVMAFFLMKRPHFFLYTLHLAMFFPTTTVDWSTGITWLIPITSQPLLQCHPPQVIIIFPRSLSTTFKYCSWGEVLGNCFPHDLTLTFIYRLPIRWMSLPVSPLLGWCGCPPCSCIFFSLTNSRGFEIFLTSSGWQLPSCLDPICLFSSPLMIPQARPSIIFNPFFSIAVKVKMPFFKIGCYLPISYQAPQLSPSPHSPITCNTVVQL